MTKYGYKKPRIKNYTKRFLDKASLADDAMSIGYRLGKSFTLKHDRNGWKAGEQVVWCYKPKSQAQIRRERRNYNAGYFKMMKKTSARNMRGRQKNNKEHRRSIRRFRNLKRHYSAKTRTINRYKRTSTQWRRK